MAPQQRYVEANHVPKLLGVVLRSARALGLSVLICTKDRCSFVVFALTLLTYSQRIKNKATSLKGNFELSKVHMLRTARRTTDGRSNGDGDQTASDGDQTASDRDQTDA